MSNNAAVATSRRRKRVSGVLWWCRECFAVVIWAALITKTLVFDFDIALIEKLAPEHSWILKCKFFAILAVLALLCLLLGRSWFRTGLLYLLFYPFVLVLWRVPSLLFRNWAIAISFAPAMHSVVTTFRATFVWAAVAMLSAFTIAVFQQRYVLATVMCVLLIFLGRHFCLDFRLAFRPSSVFANFAGFVRQLRALLEEKLFAEHARKFSELDPQCEEYKKEYQSNLQDAYVCNSVLLFLAQKLKQVAESRKLDVYFICTLLFTFLLTVVVFAFEYLALYKIDRTSFVPSEGVGFLDFLRLSFSTLMTASAASVSPASAWAHTICSVELLATLLLIFILASIVLAVARERYREDMELVVDELNASATAIAAQMEEGYQLTYDQLEQQLIRHSLKLVNAMRRMRGLNELPAPEPDTDAEEDGEGISP